MADNMREENIIRKYLLGQLPEDRRDEVEKRLLIDDDYVDELSMAEEDLIDDYVRGALNAMERAQFELKFLTTGERGKQIAFARSLNRYIQGVPEGKSVKPVVQPVKRSWFQSMLISFSAQSQALRLAFVAAGLIVLAGGTWLAIRIWQQQRRPAPTVAEQPGTQPTEQPPAIAQQNNNAAPRPSTQNTNAGQSPAAPTPPAPSRSDFATLVLTPGSLRSGGQTPKVVIEPHQKSVRLRLDIDDPATTYRAVLLNDQGKTLLRRDSLRARETRGNKSVSIDVSASALPDGDYHVRLSGQHDGQYEEVATYYFRVEKK